MADATSVDRSEASEVLAHYQQESVHRITADIGNAADRAALSQVSVRGAPSGIIRYLCERGREGIFVWDGSDLSSKISSDPEQGIYVAPAPSTGLATNGSQGAWVRRFWGPVSVTWYGAGGGDDTKAFRSALLAGWAVFVPAGEYVITETITLPNGAYLIGAGPSRTIINSNIPGASLFNTKSNTMFFYVAHMRLNGNGLTGASGSGHCFNFIDPGVGVRTATPQNGQLEHLEIKNFLGSDVVDNAGARKMQSAAIFQYDGLQNTYRYVYARDCGNGFVFRQTQNCRLENCATDNIDMAGLASYQNVNLIVQNCDIVNCGRAGGETDGGYPIATMGMGCILSYLDDQLAVIGTKVKNFNGTAAIVVKLGRGIVFDKCWLRGDTTYDIPHKTVYGEQTAGLKFTNTVFSPGVTSYAATRAFETIECYANQDAPAFDISIDGCVFEDVSGQNIAYNVKLRGDSDSRTFRVNIENNTFGSASSRSAATTVTNDILISNCNLASSRIGGNVHVASNNVTRTACVGASAITKRKATIGPSEFEANGGTISADYSGINETVLWGSAPHIRANMATGTRLTTTIPVPGVTLARGYSVQLSMNVDTKGVSLWGYVSAANTITAIYENSTGSAKVIGSGVIYARAEEYGVSEVLEGKDSKLRGSTEKAAPLSSVVPL